MTAHAHDPAQHGGSHGEPVDRAAPSTTSRPRWLVPGLVGAAIVGGLVVAGVVPLSTVLYAGLFGGMILMHVGGHGHGGHGGNSGSGGHGGHAGRGGGHGGHGGGSAAGGPDPRSDGADAAADLSARSGGAQPGGSGSLAGLAERARDDATTSETEDHDQPRTHSCH